MFISDERVSVDGFDELANGVSGRNTAVGREHEPNLDGSVLEHHVRAARAEQIETREARQRRPLSHAEVVRAVAGGLEKF